MNDEELLLFFLLLLQLLQQNRQLRFRRLFAFAFMLQWQRLLHLQRTAIQHFISLYRSRRAWVYHRRNNEFDEYYNANVHGHLELDPDYWRSNFRMSCDSFQFLCNAVHDFLVKEVSHLRETIPVPKRVAVALWWLSNGGSYCTIGQTFGISSSIVGRITKDFVGALVHLRNEFISWPQTPEECSAAVASFRDLSPLPNVLAAIDGMHIQIIAPEESTVDFFDRKQRYSIGCQGVCDGNMKFFSMSAGFPGSLHDSRILRNSWVFADANNEQILRTPLFQLDDRNSIEPYLVGDAAYSLSRWLIKPFPFSNEMESNAGAFNLASSQARVSIERAFGVLKGRWRTLSGKVCLEPSYAADVVIACTVLHNICQERNEPEESILDPYLDESNMENAIGGNAMNETDGERKRSLLLAFIENSRNELSDITNN